MKSFQDCYKILQRAYPKYVASKYVYYNGYYIFQLVPKNDTEERLIDSMISVDEKTGEIGAYQPINDRNADEFFKLWDDNKSSEFKGFLV